mgnify:FL=1
MHILYIVKKKLHASTKEEDVRSIRRNMDEMIDFLLYHHYDQENRVAAITHYRSESILIITVLSMPPDGDYTRFGQNNCGMSLIRISFDMA